MHIDAGENNLHLSKLKHLKFTKIAKILKCMRLVLEILEIAVSDLMVQVLYGREVL